MSAPINALQNFFIFQEANMQQSKILNLKS
jgi:hypothetical protein